MSLIDAAYLQETCTCLIYYLIVRAKKAKKNNEKFMYKIFRFFLLFLAPTTKNG